MKMDRRCFMCGLLATTAVGGLTGCVENRATGRSSFTGFQSVEDDIQMGRQAHPKLVEAFGGEYQDRQLQSYVTSVGERLASRAEYQVYPYTFTVLNSPIVNAFALPGGYIYLSRGLLALASNEAELAGVLAHELGHVNARHSAERAGATQVGQLGVLAVTIGAAVLGLPPDIAQLGQSIAAVSIQSYSRQQEFEADSLGVRYMSEAGYDPEAMVTFLSSLREHSMLEARMKGRSPSEVDQFNIMSTHPRTSERVREAMSAVAAARPENAVIDRPAYLRQIDGMLFGDDPRQGIVSGQAFIHPGLDFRFEVPPGFTLHNETDQVIAQNGSGAGIVFDIAPISGGASMAQYVQNEWSGRTQLQSVESINVNGMEAATGVVRLNSQGGPVELRPVAIRRDARSAFRLLFIAPVSQSASLSEPFRRTTYSFRRLKPGEAEQIRPLHLNVREARQGESVPSLATSLPYGRYNEEWFRLLNDMAKGAALRRGETIKVVTT